MPMYLIYIISKYMLSTTYNKYSIQQMISTLPITNSGISMIIMKSIRDYNGPNTQLKFYCRKLNDLKKPAHVSVDNCPTQSLSIILDSIQK